MATQFRMQPFGCGHKPLHQVMADHRGSPPSFPPSRVGDHSMKQVFRTVASKNQKCFIKTVSNAEIGTGFQNEVQDHTKIFSNEQVPTMACLQKRERGIQNICYCEAAFGGDISNMRVSEPTFATE